MAWSLAMCPDDAKQDPVMNAAEFGVVFLAESSRTASIQEGLDCLGLTNISSIGSTAVSCRGGTNRYTGHLHY